MTTQKIIDELRKIAEYSMSKGELCAEAAERLEELRDIVVQYQQNIVPMLHETIEELRRNGTGTRRR